jgi:RNA polymerase-binding transcription factor DksA
VEDKDMSEYADIYSEYGLKSMIEDNLKKIEEKKNDIVEVKAGRKWHSLWKDENVKILEEDIQMLENEIKEFKKALQIQNGIWGSCKNCLKSIEMPDMCYAITGLCFNCKIKQDLKRHLKS